MAQNISRSSVCFSTFMLSILVMISKSKSSPNRLGHFCSNNTMFANNSQYQTNLNTLFDYLTTNATNPTGYHQAVSSNGGTTEEAIYGHFLCRGDQNTSSCHKCVKTATTIDLPRTFCPNRKNAILWYDECMVRYSNQSFFGSMDERPAKFYWNTDSISNNMTRLMELMKTMMNDVIAVRAATGGSEKKFATDYVNNTVFQTIYGLGQCTPDLSPNDCYSCLVDAVTNFKTTQGGRVMLPSCNVRYEVFSFFDLSSLPPSPSQPPSPTANFTLPSEKRNNTIKLAILITVPTVVAITLAIGLSFLCCRRKRTESITSSASPHRGESDDSITLVSLLFRFDTIRVATNNFSEANKLGRGGFGIVYKGTLANGQEIAVKRLAMDSGQGDSEFKTEVLLVAKLQHRNLVKLLGFCLHEKERLLIYEFVANTSLDHFLFDASKRTYLNWPTRYKIITGIARGILYLHEDSRLRIIHRDLKASNVLLDADMSPKIADFGLARLFGVDQTQGDTNRIVGTYGYMAPEYAFHGLFSIKSDVFSFGVLVLEIVTGRKNIGSLNEENGEDLISFVWRNWREDTALDIVDPTLSTRSRTGIIRCIHIGLLCVQESVEDRPTMSSVVLMLSSHSLNLPVPSQPAFVIQTASIAVHQNSNNITNRPLENASVNSKYEDSFTDLHPR